MSTTYHFEVVPHVLDDVPPPRRATRLTRAHIALIVVCLLHVLMPLIIRGVHAGLGTDETVYISQIDPHVPAGVFSAPRARGVTLLTAPASLLSPSIAVLRIWLALLSGVGLFLAFIPWLRLRKGAVVPLAAALWSTLWISSYYGFEAMPNQYVGYGAVAATGWLVLALREPARKRDVAYLAMALAFTALIRPTDTLFLIVALGGTVIVVRGLSVRRRITLLALIGVGFAGGFVEWVIEAYVRFGGPIARFHAASAENTGGLHWSLGAQMRTLAGPLLCRNSCAVSSPLTARLWWFALLPLVVLGLAAARRQRVSRPFVIATAAALAMAAEYLVAIGYSAPRFLEPTYLLLALPVAEGLVWAGRHVAPAWRPIAIIAAVTVVGAQLSVQTHIVQRLNSVQTEATARDQAISDSLRAGGIHGDCWINGTDAQVVAFMTGCHDTLLPMRKQRTAAVPPVAMAVIERRPSDATTDYSAWPEYSIRDRFVRGTWRIWIQRPSDALQDHPELAVGSLSPERRGAAVGRLR